LTPHISRTPANICITLISLETTFTGLVFLLLTVWVYLHSFSCRSLPNTRITRNSEIIRPYSSSRSSKVIDLGLNRKPIHDFLLVINSNFGRILHRFRDIAARRSRSRFFALPHLPLRPPLSGTPSEFLDETYPRKTRGMGLLYGENCVILASTAFD